MDRNIFELLEDWDLAKEIDDKKRERGLQGEIEVLRMDYREKSNKAEKVEIVGVFDGNLWAVYVNNEHFGTFFNLKYTGRANSFTDRRLYTNEDVHIWLDYAVYE